ncbi:MAG: hypothetical protein LDL41_18305 [Coleofasciculus sp. S288]|nr:hypothetical protein [Coleofasciculus sp. S288]
MFSSIPIPIPAPSIRDEISNLVLKANALRDEAWRKEQDAIRKLENLIANGRVVEAKAQAVDEVSVIGELSFDPDAPPIWELVAEISAQVPDEEWKKLPTDLARRFDYYQQQKKRDD